MGETHGFGRGNGVRNGQHFDFGRRDARDGAAGEYAMADIDADGTRIGSQQRLRGIAQRTAGIHDVVDDDAIAAFNLTDDVHHFRDARAFTAFVDNRKVRIEAPGDNARAQHAADIRGDDHRFAAREALFDVLGEERAQR